MAVGASIDALEKLLDNYDHVMINMCKYNHEMINMCQYNLWDSNSMRCKWKWYFDISWDVDRNVLNKVMAWDVRST